MADLTYTYLLSDARKSLTDHRLLSALESLRGLATLLHATTAADEAGSLLDSYQLLLNYMTLGAEDPQRAKMYQGFDRRAWELCDLLDRKGLLTNTTCHYTTSLRTLQQLRGEDLTPATILSGTLPPRDIFDALWLSDAWSSEDEASVFGFLHDKDIPSHLKALALSAITLSALQFFDIAKYRQLLGAAQRPDPLLRVRALVGLVFIHMAHPGRPMRYPDIEAQLSLMSDNLQFKAEIELIQMQLFLSLETKRIERDLREEIIPQMMKRINHLRLDRSLGIEELKEKLSASELNPEWENNGKSSKLADSMKEYMRLQERGADMYLGSFKMLKQRFPFFNVAANWFYPFTLSHPDISKAACNNDTLRLLLRGVSLCDTDKYCFAFMAEMFNKLPSGMQLGGKDIGDLLQEMKARHDEDNPTIPDAQADFKAELRSYVQAFYRFCHLYTHRESFANPFRLNPLLIDYTPFDRLLADNDYIARMADFAFTDKAYALALNLFERIPQDQRTAAQCQKLGYCYEDTRRTSDAIHAYELANALRPSSEWTLQHLAACHRLAGNYQEALLYYTELSKLRPENTLVALRQAECLIHLDRHEEAFKYLFKADYLSPDNGQSTRALAWCSLLTHKYEQAERYYIKILGDNPTPSDWLNAGHAAWLQGNIREAIHRYSHALPGESPEKFLDADRALLLSAGLTAQDLSLMTDAVLYLRDAGNAPQS